MTNINFEVPASNEDLAKLLEAVPLDWYGVEATLRPDIELIKTGGILPNTGFGIINDIHGYGSGFPVFYHVEDVAFEDAIGGNIPKRHRTKPKSNLAEILFRHKLPSSIEFLGIPFSNADRELEFQREREIAIQATRLGYKGYLCFHKYEDSLRAGLCLNQRIEDPNQGINILCVLAERVENGELELKTELDEGIRKLIQARTEGYKTTETLSAYYDGNKGKYEDVLPLVSRAIELGIRIIE